MMSLSAGAPLIDVECLSVRLRRDAGRILESLEKSDLQDVKIIAVEEHDIHNPIHHCGIEERRPLADTIAMLGFKNTDKTEYMSTKNW